MPPNCLLGWERLEKEGIKGKAMIDWKNEYGGVSGYDSTGTFHAVRWDSQDPNNVGYAYSTRSFSETESGGLLADTLPEAIAEYEGMVNLSREDFEQRTFEWSEKPVDRLKALDLRGPHEDFREVIAYNIGVHYPGGGFYPEEAEALHLIDEELMGIAWGGTADWGHVYPSRKDVEQAIGEWLNDSEAWAARN
jgi:hypothetical protein